MPDPKPDPPERPGTEDLTLLGHSGASFPASPDEAVLETFANRSPQRAYWITLDTHDFSSLCPVTGQPDFARIQIRYVPSARCVETKSLKFYLASFRNTRAFNEDVVNRIADDLLAACAPQRLVVRGEFSARGGIQLSVEVTHPEPEP